MSLFIIERNWAERLEVDPETIKSVQEINEDCNVKWITSFLSADKRKTYCLYEADSPEGLREAAKRAGIPADVIVELSGEINPAEY